MHKVSYIGNGMWKTVRKYYDEDSVRTCRKVFQQIHHCQDSDIGVRPMSSDSHYHYYTVGRYVVDDTPIGNQMVFCVELPY